MVKWRGHQGEKSREPAESVTEDDVPHLVALYESGFYHSGEEEDDEGEEEEKKKKEGGRVFYSLGCCGLVVLPFDSNEMKSWMFQLQDCWCATEAPRLNCQTVLAGEEFPKVGACSCVIGWWLGKNGRLLLGKGAFS